MNDLLILLALTLWWMCRRQLKAVLHNVGVCATEDFDAFIADGGQGEVQMRKLQAAAESSGIAGQSTQCNYSFYGAYLKPFVQVFRTMLFHRPSHPTVELEACLVESTLRSYGDGFMCDSASAAPLLNLLDTNVHCCRGTDFSVTKKLHPIFHMHGRLRCQNEHFISAWNTSSVHAFLLRLIHENMRFKCVCI